MKKEDLREYVNLSKRINNKIVTIEDMKLQHKFMDLYKTDEKWKNFITEAAKTKSEAELEKFVEEYIKRENLDIIEQNDNSKESKIAAAYGVKKENIEKISLKSGKSVYKFYSEKVNKYILLDSENLENEINELNEMKKNNPDKSEMDILEQQRINKNNDLEMIYVGDIKNQTERISKLNNEQVSNLMQLLNKKEELELEYVNFENCMAITKNGIVIEAYYSKDENKYVVEAAKNNSINRSEDKIDNIQPNNLVRDTSAQQDLEKTVVFTKEETDQIKISLDPEKAEMYYNYPELLENPNLTDEERNMYKHNNESINAGKAKVVEMPKVKQYKLNKAGYADALMLSLVTGFFGGMLTTIAISLFQIKSI